jgi:hypothetical protein
MLGLGAEEKMRDGNTRRQRGSGPQTEYLGMADGWWDTSRRRPNDYLERLVGARPRRRRLHRPDLCM